MRTLWPGDGQESIFSLSCRNGPRGPGSHPLPWKPSQSPGNLSLPHPKLLFGETLAAPLTSPLPPSYGDTYESLLPLCGHRAPGGPHGLLACVCSHATPNSMKQGFFPAPAGGFIMQKVSLCSLSETQLGIKGFLPWGDSKKVASPLLWGGAGEGFQGSRALVWLPGLLGACVPPCPLLAFTSRISKQDE